MTSVTIDESIARRLLIQACRSMRLSSLVLILLLTGCRYASGATQPAREAPVVPLPGALADVWQAAGAEIGWIGERPDEIARFQVQPRGLADPLPAFKFGKWKAGQLSSLPSPVSPFGLDFSVTNITDADIRSISGI